MPVVLLGEELWTSRLGRDPRILGATVRVNDRPATVLGIVPAGFRGLEVMQQEVKVWLPMHQIDYFIAESNFKTNWSGGGPATYGRLRPGVNLAAAKESLRTLMAEIAHQQPAEFTSGEWLEPHSAAVYFDRPDDYRLRRSVTLLVGGLFVIVLLIVCTNLSGIILARGMNKVRELSVRAALGAGAGRIMAHLLAESGLIGIAGTALGILVGRWTLALFAARIESPWLRWAPDWNTIIVSLGMAVFATCAVGLVPAWKITRRRQELAAAIKDGGQQTSAALHRTRLRHAFIGIQVAGACVLLVVAGMLVQHFQRMITSPGFEFSNVIVLNAFLDRFGITGAEARSFWRGVKSGISTQANVESIALVSTPPLGQSLTTSRYEGARDIEVAVLRVDPDFFAVMSIPILAGRTFAGSDDFRTSVIISRRLALRMYGTVNVAGKTFPIHKPERTIVGVVDDARLIRLERLNDAEAYFPVNPERLAGVSLVARARANPEQLLAPLRTIARNSDSRILPDAHLMRTDYQEKLKSKLDMSLIAVSLGLVALLVASVGIFGLLSYAVTLRNKEIGIRIALGARRRAVLRLLAGQLTQPMAAGTVLGIAGGIATSKALAAQAESLQTADGVVIVTVVLVFLASMVLASTLPAIRAIRIDVLDALRHE